MDGYGMIQIWDTPTTSCFVNPYQDICYWFSSTGDSRQIAPVGWPGQSHYLYKIPHPEAGAPVLDEPVPTVPGIDAPASQMPPMTPAIPEPATWVMMAGALVLAAICRKKIRG